MVGEPFFDHGRPLTLGRMGAVDAAAGDLVAVTVTGPGRGTVTERLGRVADASAVLHGLERKGLIERHASPGDRRGMIVRAAQHGRPTPRCGRPPR